MFPQWGSFMGLTLSKSMTKRRVSGRKEKVAEKKLRSPSQSDVSETSAGGSLVFEGWDAGGKRRRDQTSYAGHGSAWL